MKLIKQTSPTTCGQCCIAMLLGISEAEAIQMVGHDRITSDEDLISTIKWACTPTAKAADDFISGTPPENILALVKHREPIKFTESATIASHREHWTIWDHGVILDPACIGKKLWPAYKHLIIS